jgi:hypothetical protein
VTDIIAAIDSATGCQQCGKDLSGSVSDDFCSEQCQRAWQAANVARVQSWNAASASPFDDLVDAYRILADSGRHYRPLLTHFTVNADGTLTQNLPTDAAFVIPAGGQVFRSNGGTWEPFGTITSDSTIQEER